MGASYYRRASVVTTARGRCCGVNSLSTNRDGGKVQKSELAGADQGVADRNPEREVAPMCYPQVLRTLYLIASLQMD